MLQSRKWIETGTGDGFATGTGSGSGPDSRDFGLFPKKYSMEEHRGRGIF